MHGNPVEPVERGSAQKILCLFCKRLLLAGQATNKAFGDKKCVCAHVQAHVLYIPKYCECVCTLFACVCFLRVYKRQHPDRKLLLISVAGQ